MAVFTCDFLQWRLFAKPERVQVFMAVLLTASEFGAVTCAPDRISQLTGLSLVTVQRSLDDLVADGRLRADNGGYVLSTMPRGVVLGTAAKRTAQRRKTMNIPITMSKVFARPTLEDVTAYIQEKGYTFSADEFIAFYDSNGWKVGRNAMKDWHGACRTWQARQKKGPSLTDVSKESYTESW